MTFGAKKAVEIDLTKAMGLRLFEQADGGRAVFVAGVEIDLTKAMGLRLCQLISLARFESTVEIDLTKAMGLRRQFIYCSPFSYFLWK